MLKTYLKNIYSLLLFELLSLSLSFPPFLTLWFYFYDAFNSKHQAVSRFECPSWRSDSRAADSERKKNY